MNWIAENKFFNRYLPLFLSVVVVVASGLIYSVVKDSKVAESAWYSSGGTWSYRKQITIDHTKVSGASTLSSFPMLFSVTDNDLKYTGSGGKVGKADGTDILFTSSDGTTKLDHEIEKYASTTGETITWVEIPSLSPSTDTIIYIYYGNSGASDQQNAAGVWDSNYQGVWHLPNGSSLGALDSTSNDNDGTINSAGAVTGKIDGGASFNGSSHSISKSSAVATTTSITMSGWFYTGSTAGVQPVATVQGADDGNMYRLILYQGKVQGQKQSSGGSVLAATSDYTTNQWTYAAVVFSGDITVTPYINGTVGTPGPGSGLPTSLTQTFIGKTVSADEYMNGNLDEIRISNVARSADWIATEYNNQNSPSTFYAVGAENTPRSATTPGVKVYAPSREGSGSATIALVDHNVCAGGTCTTGAMNTSGATLLVAVVSQYATSPLTGTLSDSKANTWQALTAYESGSTNGNIVIYYAYNKAGGPLSVGSSHTVTLSGGQLAAVEVMAFSGTLTTSDPFDVQNGATSSNSSNPFQPGSITPSQSNELIITGYGANATSRAINAGFTVTDFVDYGSTTGGGAAYLVQGIAAAVNPSWTFQSSGLGAAAVIASFKAAAQVGSNGPSVKIRGGVKFR
jgi:hypothetical protein